VNRDFAEFFALLNQHGVEFLIIGGVAYNFHAPPRATKHIDVWVRPTRENLMIGRAPTRIDVLTRPDGLDWDGAWSRRMNTDYGDVPISVLAIEDLISSKRAAGRPRDLADVSMLERILARK
jgi:hypothetical protein